jgi:RimJ/RimL family protein N-acetyltransferase
MIRGKNIYLRIVRETDLDFYYERVCDVDGAGQYEYYPIDVPSETEFKRKFHENGFWTDNYGELLICALDDSIIGVIIFFKAASYFDGFEIAARIFSADHRNRGVMTEALTLFTYLLFTMKKINRLELKIVPANAPSKRVAQKCGYQFEGVARGAVFHRGAHRDLEVHSILRHEAPATLEDALARVANKRKA